MKKETGKKQLLPGITPGTVKAFIFVLLIGIAIAIWLYTEFIFKQVRDFQKSVARIQVAIYVKIIDPDPSAPDISDLFEYMKDSPLPRIITDEHLNPIRGYWSNVGIHPDSTDDDSYRKLRRLVEKMDKTNDPFPFHVLGLEARTDTLTVYEYPPSRMSPIAVSDTLGKFLYTRNIRIDSTDGQNLDIFVKRLDTFTPPMTFIKNDSPPLVFHGMNPRLIWPVLIKNKSGETVYWSDINVAWNDTTEAGRKKLDSFAELAGNQGFVYELITNYSVPVYSTQLLHYGDVPFLTWIGWLPVIEFAVLLILLFVGFVGFRNITNAEQRSIWVGMAKETAHQLGTPISSLGGWLELLKTDREDTTINQAVPEMEYDVERLTRVAARFSSIGSKPELQLIVLPDILDEVLEYFRARVPRMRNNIVLDGSYSGLREIMGNREILNWAFENLIKNSLASLQSNGGRISITGAMSKDFRHIILDFTDNGKGIPYADQKKVMKPGFTTKKRGWGLGLSLVKRIIEEYHGGKVFLSESKPGVSTTFRIILPAVEEDNSRLKIED